MHLPDPRAALAAILIAGLAGASLPARAETLEELDVLSDRSADEQSGIALAQEQAERGEYLEAISTLERVLAEQPKSAAARLLHAFFLCKVDDRTGGAVEIGKLKKKEYEDDVLARVRAQCGMAGED